MTPWSIAAATLELPTAEFRVAVPHLLRIEQALAGVVHWSGQRVLLSDGAVVLAGTSVS